MVNYFLPFARDEEILESQSFLGKIADKSLSEDHGRLIAASWDWSLNSSGKFTIKSLTHHLSPPSPLDKSLYKAIWKSSSPRRVNILIWILMVGNLDVSSAIQHELPNSHLSPSICLLYLQNKEDPQHLFIFCKYSANCWEKLFKII